MDRSELKKTAIESMSSCGALMREENYAEAKRLAEKAWNCYFELQKTRSDDEDFTDLIYYAREYYYDCENKLRLKAEEEARKEDERLAREYAKLREKAETGLAGSPGAALSAAIDYLRPKHWAYFAEMGIDFSKEAAKLLNVALKDDDPFFTGVAAIYTARLYRQPLHGACDIDKSLYYARYAVTQLHKCNDQVEDLLIRACEEVIYAACCKGEIKLACEYAQLARDNGSDMGVFREIATYGFRHDEKSAQEVEDQMYADGCWEGILMHGQGLVNNWIIASNTPDKYDASEVAKIQDEVNDYVRGVLYDYVDNHSGKVGGYACAALAVFAEFLQSYEEILSNDDFMRFAKDGADAYEPVSLYYLGYIYEIAANTIAMNNADDERIPELRSKSFHYYTLGAGVGHRGSIRCYLNMLKEDPEKNAALIERYTDITRQLDVVLD